MVTGYEQDLYNAINSMSKSLARIEASSERQAQALEIIAKTETHQERIARALERLVSLMLVNQQAQQEELRRKGE
jgi:hypothetical protein